MSSNRYQNRVELLQGTLDMLILQTLQWGPQHEYAIANAIRANSGDLLHVETGSLYPALHRLERQKWLKSDWKQTEAGQRAKFYRLTPAGKSSFFRNGIDGRSLLARLRVSLIQRPVASDPWRFQVGSETVGVVKKT